MNTHKLLLCLYPRAWRVRYEEEFLLVLTTHPFSLLEGIDLLRGAIDAHLHPHLGIKDMPQQEKLRHLLSVLQHSLLILFVAYSGSVLTDLVYAKMTEETLSEVMHRSAIAGTAYSITFLCSIGTLLAMLAVGLPLAFAVIKHARATKQRGLLLLLVIPLIALVVFEGVIRLSVSPWSLTSKIGFSVFFFAEAVISTAAVCIAIARSKIDANLLYSVTIPARIATIMMVIMLAATLCWGLSVQSNAPLLFTSVGFMGAATNHIWGAITITMSISTCLALIAVARGMSTSLLLRCQSLSRGEQDHA